MAQRVTGNLQTSRAMMRDISQNCVPSGASAGWACPRQQAGHRRRRSLCWADRECTRLELLIEDILNAEPAGPTIHYTSDFKPGTPLVALKVVEDNHLLPITQQVVMEGSTQAKL